MEAIEFKITPGDFLQAQRLHQTVSLRRRGFLIRIGLFMSALALLFATIAPGGGSNRILWGLAAPAIYVAVIGCSVALSRFVFLPFSSARQFSQRKDFDSPLRYAVESPHISVTSENGSSRIPTEHFLKWIEDRTTILLYRSDNMFNLIPKRAIPDPFYAELIGELARARVPRAGFRSG